MNNFNSQLKASASDFKNLVWPAIVDMGWLKGYIEPVELQSTKQWAKQLDYLAGIDAWLIKSDGLTGIASRVQWRPDYPDPTYPYNTINMRTLRRDGFSTELPKRIKAITSSGELLYPYWTCHAYLEQRVVGPILAIGLIRTQDLVEAVSLKYGFDKTNKEDGNIFHCVSFRTLKDKEYQFYSFPQLNQLPLLTITPERN